MRIAQIAPLTEAVPPTLYGGTERVISWLTEELVALGQDVTLFASGDSVTSAKLQPMWPRALRLDGTVRDPNALHMMMIEQVYRTRRMNSISCIFTSTIFLFRSCRDSRRPSSRRFTAAWICQSTIRLSRPFPRSRRLDFECAAPAGSRKRTGSRRCITGCLRTCCGRSRSSPPISPSSDAYLPKRRGSGDRHRATLRTSSENRRQGRSRGRGLFQRHRPSVAFDARRRIHRRDRRRPRSREFLSGAMALLAPIDWPEPFGLVMIEAMACGAPVIAFNRGSVPEIVEDGVTGFVVEDETSAAAAVREVASLSRSAIRRRFEERFTAQRHGRRLHRLYRKLIDGERARPRLRIGLGGDAGMRGRLRLRHRQQRRRASRPPRSAVNMLNAAWLPKLSLT